MDFFKKIFGGKKDDNAASAVSPGGETFKCENCGQERPLSQKKEHMAHEGEKAKNVCEFC